MEQMINILSLDPGSSNFGWSVLRGRRLGDRISFQIVANGMCPCPIKRVKGSKDLEIDGKAFTSWFAKMLKTYDIDAVCAERFMARGLMGALGEFVGIMMGIMLRELQGWDGVPLKIFPAATWKNAVRRNAGDKEFLNQTYKIAKVLPHQLDAALMGVWTLYQGFGFKDFGDLDLVKSRDKLLTQIESTSEVKLINRKIKR